MAEERSGEHWRHLHPDHRKSLIKKIRGFPWVSVRNYKRIDTDEEAAGQDGLRELLELCKGQREGL